MNPRVVVPIATAVLMLVGAPIGGYLLGDAAAPDAANAAAEREEAAVLGAIQARSLAIPAGVSRGWEVGLAAGQTDGQEDGMLEGESAGELVAAKQAGPVLTRGDASRRSGVGGSPELPGDGGVLIVGDSLEVATEPYFENYLSGVEVTHTAVVGYNSYQIFDLFEENYEASMSVIVFDAGTNDDPSSPEILAGNLQEVAKVVGDRCMVVPTIHAPPVGGVDSTGKNRVIEDFAASRPGTQTPDWAGAVRENPELLQPDNLHPNAEGAELRAQLIAEGIEACLNGGSSL